MELFPLALSSLTDVQERMWGWSLSCFSQPTMGKVDLADKSSNGPRVLPKAANGGCVFLPQTRKGDGVWSAAVSVLLAAVPLSGVCTAVPRGDATEVIPWLFAPISHVSACTCIDYFQTLCNMKA